MRSHIDLTTHTLVADVPVGDEVFVITAGPGGDTGTYSATPLASSSKWQVNFLIGQK